MSEPVVLAQSEWQDWLEKYDRLKAENGRLRTALERIANQQSDIYVRCYTNFEGEGTQTHYRSSYEALNAAYKVAAEAIQGCDAEGKGGMMQSAE